MADEIQSADETPRRKRGGPIYFVCVMLLDHEKEEIRHDRTWAWYAEFKDAERCVLENHTDLWEAGGYNYAVIEAVQEGILFPVPEETWYQATYTARDGGFNPTVTRVEKPAWLRQIIFYAIG